MNDADCTAFLQWALPQLELRWSGFRKVRKQVCKRLNARIRDLGLDNYSDYRARLEADSSEWLVLDECCHITISRFFRDRGVFEIVRDQVLPDIAERAKREGRDARIWSAGCASGEEPYTLRLLWDVEVARLCPGVPLTIIASDVDKAMLVRARDGCFKPSSLRELPPPLIEQAFDRVGSQLCIRSKFRDGVEFFAQDLRTEMPAHLFDLILCRNVAFTYFTAQLQRKVLVRMLKRLRPEGYLVIGSHEELPGQVPELVSPFGIRQILQKRSGR